MSISCKQAQEDLADLKKDLAWFKDELEQFKQIGSKEYQERIESIRSSIQLDADILREKLDLMSYQQAKELFGEDFFSGYEVARDLFGAATPEESEPLPFTRQELLEAKNRGMFLMYRPIKTKGGHGYDIEALLATFRNRKNPEMRHFNSSDAEQLLRKSSEYLEEANKRWQRRERLNDGWSLLDTSSVDEEVTPFQDDRFEPQFSVFNELKRTALEKEDNPNVFIPRTIDVVYDMIASRMIFGTLVNRGRFLTREKEVDDKGMIAGFDSISVFDDGHGDLDAEFNLAKRGDKVKLYLSMNRKWFE